MKADRVQELLNQSKHEATTRGMKYVPCPCRDCLGCRMKSLDEVERHLILNGPEPFLDPRMEKEKKVKLIENIHKMFHKKTYLMCF